jgi:hypothetical protein
MFKIKFISKDLPDLKLNWYRFTHIDRFCTLKLQLQIKKMKTKSKEYLDKKRNKQFCIN